MSASPRCPVCDQPAGPAAPEPAEVVCGRCGWPLRQPLRAGPVTLEMGRDFDVLLKSARRSQADRDGRALDDELRQVIADLTQRTGAAVIDVAAAQVTVARAGLDEADSPQVREEASVPWASVLPMLATAEPDRHAQLADGLDGLAPESVAGLIRDRLPALGRDRMLVICRPSGWQIPERVAAALAEGPRARLVRLSGAISVAVYQQLTELAAREPLRQPYWLMTAAVDRDTGAVALSPRPLFAAGAEPGAEVRLTLAKMPGDMTSTTLAIFAGPPDLRGAGANRPLALFAAPPQPAAAASRLHVVLDGPGKVRIVEPADTVPHAGSWADVRGQIPDQVTTAATPVDLLCGIDMAGTRDDVRDRVRLVRDLLKLLGGEYPAERRLRVGVVTCTDHVFGRRRGDEHAPVTSTHDLGPAQDALDWLARQSGADVAYPPCSAVEDLLNEAKEQLAGSRRAGRSPRLLTVAGRLPHPREQGADTRVPCPRGISWRSIIDQLSRAGTRCVCVADGLPQARADQTEWRRLGPSGLRLLADTTARQVAEDLGLLAGQDQRIPLPLTDELEGAVR